MRFLTICLTCCLWLFTDYVQGKIVFSSRRDGNLEIYMMGSDGSDQTRLTHNKARDSSPIWSPNGREIAFMSKRDGNWEVYVMDASGGNQRNLTQHPADDGDPDWAPNGGQITFSRGQNDEVTSNIFVMDADGGNVRRITRFQRLQFASNPKWSPDGKHIAFEGMLGMGMGRQIYVVNVKPDGTNPWQVSQPIPDTAMFLSGWSPDGEQILHKASLHSLVKNSTPIIVTLHPTRRKTFTHERVQLPKMDLARIGWGADEKSILITARQEGKEWDIYRFRLSDGQLTRLTDHPASDSSPNEWNPRLPVSPQGLIPKCWGAIKSDS